MTIRTHGTDAIVALGRGVRADGSLGLIARGRVDRALELFNRGVAPRIIFSGRSSLMSEGLPIVTEASAMAAYAMSRGLPPSASLVEEESRDTIGNAYFVRTTVNLTSEVTGSPPALQSIDAEVFAFTKNRT